MKIPTVVKVNSVSLNYTDVRLSSKGQTLQLTATVSPSNASNKSVKWTSSNTKVATVSSSGKVTAVANGNTTITATAADGSGKKDICAVTVNIPKPADPTPTPTPSVVKVSSVSLNQSSLSLTKKGQTAQLSASVSPSNATNKSINWSSSNSNVATVSNGVITAVGNGNATITATAADGSGKKASCSVTVNIPTTPDTQTITLAGGNADQCTIGWWDEIAASIDLSKITFQINGNDQCIEITGTGYDSSMQQSYFGFRALKQGSLRITAMYNNKVIRVWNINITSNWSVYTKYESWKRSVEAQIWTNGMSVAEKLNALCYYIQDNWGYGSMSNKLYAMDYKYMDCVGAADLFGDMAKDANAEVRYVNKNGQMYTYLVEAVSNSYGHVYNAVLLNNQWVSFDATP